MRCGANSAGLSGLTEAEIHVIYIGIETEINSFLWSLVEVNILHVSPYVYVLEQLVRAGMIVLGAADCAVFMTGSVQIRSGFTHYSDNFNLTFSCLCFNRGGSIKVGHRVCLLYIKFKVIIENVSF